MGKLFRTYMRALKDETPSPGLAKTIASDIRAFEVARVRILIAGFFLGTLLCAGIFITAVLSLSGALAASGFWQYLSLVVSDTDALAYFWKELLISLAASVPVSGLMVLLVSAGAFLYSGASFIKNAHGRMPLAHI